MRKERIQSQNTAKYTSGIVLYWMDREMRLHENWALQHAFDIAKTHNTTVGIVYNLVKDYLGGGQRQFAFKIQGLKELEALCREKNIPFTVLLTNDTENDIQTFIQKHEVGYLVSDMNPLRENRRWKKAVNTSIDIPFDIVDAHNIVPVWTASDKQEYAAYTLRPKIHKSLRVFLDDFPNLMPQGEHTITFPSTNWNAIQSANVDTTIPPVDWISAGEKAARRILRSFVDQRLRDYDEKRNDPNEEVLSNLSPYFHYGMLSPQYAALTVKASDAPLSAREAFIEEAVVRRELSDNFCYYNDRYDSVEGFPEWAQTTLNEHRDDKRAFIYTYEEFEQAKTHDPLWNAAQQQMRQTGKMHGYMRMYWAKKILEWTNVPETALRFAIKLNDRYELDGRDPNGYVGCAWSIGGVHDRAWTERPVFGKIRYMNANGCRRKFDVDTYIQTWTQSNLDTYEA